MPGYTETLRVRVSPELHRYYRRLARKLDCKLSTAVRIALNDWSTKYGTIFVDPGGNGNDADDDLRGG